MIFLVTNKFKTMFAFIPTNRTTTVTEFSHSLLVIKKTQHIYSKSPL
jgi:hypothetical protein